MFEVGPGQSFHGVCFSVPHTASRAKAKGARDSCLRPEGEACAGHWRRYCRRIFRPLTKSEARSVIASYLNVLHGDFFAAADIRIVPNDEVQRLVKRGRRGGFHVFVHAENVPNEKSLYLKAIFLLELGNTVWPESRTIEIVRTQGNEDENGLKQLLSKHLLKTHKYYVEPEEIHFITEKERAKYEALT